MSCLDATKFSQDIGDLYFVPQDKSRRDEAVRKLYADKATWSDPLTSSSGVEAIVANYRSLPTVAAYGKVKVVHATLSTENENETILRFESLAIYTTRILPLRVEISMWSVVKIRPSDTKIIEHVDHWSLESLIMCLPFFLGRAYRSLLRPSVGKLVRLVMGPWTLPPQITADPAGRAIDAIANGSTTLLGEGEKREAGGEFSPAAGVWPSNRRVDGGSIDGGDGKKG